jgi:hypothetical protein
MREWTNTIVFGAVSLLVVVLLYVTFARRMQLWSRAVLFGALSAGLIVLIYATPPYEDSHFAGANFGYNFSFFFPVVLSSFIFWSVALGFYIASLRSPSGRSPMKILSPAVLLLPFALQAAWIIRVELAVWQFV